MPDFLGKGPRFPLFDRIPADHEEAAKDPPSDESVDQHDLAKGPLLYWSDGENKIRESIRLILSTAPGERLMRPEFGCGIHDLLFEPVTSGLPALLIDRVNTALVRWEPRIDVLQVEARHDQSREHVLLLDITYRVRANNALHNMVYPFYLQEGAA